MIISNIDDKEELILREEFYGRIIYPINIFFSINSYKDSKTIKFMVVEEFSKVVLFKGWKELEQREESTFYEDLVLYNMAIREVDEFLSKIIGIVNFTLYLNDKILFSFLCGHYNLKETNPSLPLFNSFKEYLSSKSINYSFLPKSLLNKIFSRFTSTHNR